MTTTCYISLGLLKTTYRPVGEFKCILHVVSRYFGPDRYCCRTAAAGLPGVGASADLLKRHLYRQNVDNFGDTRS